MGELIDFVWLEQDIESKHFQILRGEYDGLAIILESIIEKKFMLAGKKGINFELLSYLKLKLNKHLEAFYYAMESHRNSLNSIGIIIAAMSMFNIRRHMAGKFIKKYKKDIIERMDSNKISEKSFYDIKEFSLLKSCLNHLSLSKNSINQDFSYIDNIGYYGMNSKDVQVISYKSEAMINIHILRVKDEYLILDCGAEILGDKMIKGDLELFLKGIPKEKIKAAIISHAHLDHYGSLDLLYEYVDNIYMGEDTYNLIKLVAKGINLDNSRITICKDYLDFKVGGFDITAIPNGHILGSMAFFIKNNNINIFYTGDFCFSNQNTVPGLKKKDIELLIKEKGKIDYLITESTYGHKEEWLTYTQRKELMRIFIECSYRVGIKVFIPAFAVGRAQECHSIINESDSMYLLVDGLAKVVTKYYNKNSISSNLITRRTLINTDENIDQKYENSPIIIASSGMLQHNSIAMKYYNKILGDKMTTIIKCGYMNEETIINKLKKYDEIKLNLIEINLSAHGQYEEIIELIELVKPRNLVMVHGEGIEGINKDICNG